MRFRRLIAALSVFAAAVSGPSFAQTPTTAEPLPAFGLRVPMRDGATLATDVYRPNTAARVPIILRRTPYVRTERSRVDEARYWVGQGYAYVIQDVRGRGDSDGIFDPMLNEADDGEDTIAWLIRQPWSNGRVGMVGASYSAWNQLALAPRNPPGLLALSPFAAPPDFGKSWPSRGGVPAIGMVTWLSTVEGRVLRYAVPLSTANRHRTLPIRDIDLAIGQRFNFWQTSLDRLHDAQFWQPRLYQPLLPRSRVPMLHVSGWYDAVLGGALENFAALRASPDKAIADGQYLVIGPWGHTLNSDSQRTNIDGVPLGPEAPTDLRDMLRRWFAWHLKGDAKAFADQARVRLFVMGANRWITGDRWPLAGTRVMPLYLTQGASLAGAPPSQASSRTYRYDPADPPPYLWSKDIDDSGPSDYAESDRRADTLVWRALSPSRPQTVCGPVRAELWASTSARDTDFMARLSIEQADGAVRRLTDGWIRARARKGPFANDLVRPNAVERYDIDMWATCFEVKPGERLRLSIFSAYDTLNGRNLNTGGAVGEERVPIIARQKIWMSQSSPSAIFLPVLAH